MMATVEILLVMMLGLAWAVLMLVIGYLVGWHRGALGLPLGRTRIARKRQTQPTAALVPTPVPDAPEPKSDDDIKKQLKDQFPHLTEALLDRAVDEVKTRGSQLLASQ